MKKFKLVYWSDCRGMEIDGESIVECCSNGSEVVKYLIEDKIEDEDWIDYVNDMRSDVEGFENRREDWVDMFVIGDINKEVFEVDFCNELNSCLVVREDSEYFNRDFDLDLLEEVEKKYIW
jgi:hypothetical protein